MSTPDARIAATVTQASAHGRPNLRSLTALRFVAALMVFGLHAGIVQPLTRAGASGVCFFFVLSGFVLTWSARPGVTAGQFWRNRFARLAPAYLLAWLLGIAVDVYRIGWAQAPFSRTIPGFVAMQSWFPDDRVYFAANGVSWSLSVELFFYLSFPLLLPVIVKLSTKAVTLVLTTCAALALAISALNYSGGREYWVFIFPPARLPEFVIGMALAVLVSRGRRSPVNLPIALAVAAAASVAACNAPGWTQSTTIVVVPFGLLVWSAASADLSPTAWHTDWRYLVRLGEWSYVFYLIHQLALQLWTSGAYPTRWACRSCSRQ